MVDKRPEMRPTASEADKIMQEIDEDQPIPYSGMPLQIRLFLPTDRLLTLYLGGFSSRCEIDLSISARLYPTLASDTPLPVPRDFQSEGVEW